MRKASLRDLHIRTSELVREAEEGSVIVIERRGRPVAELRPIGDEQKLSPSDRDEIFREMQPKWDSMPQVSDSTALISEGRDR